MLCIEAFTIEIAGLVCQVQPLFESTREYCRAYLSLKDPDFYVEVTREDLAFAQGMLDREAVEEGLKIRKFKEPFLERATIQRKIADRLIGMDTLLLHGSTVAVAGKAYLFTAPCGTGKSTHTRLWRELFGQRAVMLNDDKPFLQITSSGVMAYGSPWSGKHGLDSNIQVPLQGICLLRRGAENTIKRIQPQDGLAELRRQLHVPTDHLLLQRSFSLLDELVKKVPLWEMHCNKQVDAAQVSYAAMSCD